MSQAYNSKKLLSFLMVYIFPRLLSCVQRVFYCNKKLFRILYLFD